MPNRTKRPAYLKYPFYRANIPPDEASVEDSHPKLKLPTAASSPKITAIRCLYFAIFYSLLFGFTLAYLNLFMHFQIPRDHPKLTGLASSLEFNPGLSILPVVELFTSLISYVDRQPQSIASIASQLRAFLKYYDFSNYGSELSDCSAASSDTLDIRRPCHFDLNSLGPCNIADYYGFEDNNPCILLKINKIYGWVPDPVPFANGVLVTCKGATQDDTHNLGEIRYFDYDIHGTADFSTDKTQGKTLNGTFPSAFFPYLNQPQYRQPIVFVMFRGFKTNTLVRVQCYLIAKNIRVDIALGEGSVQFEILSY
ncbi:unnamed protein product [Schistocephalus solidus]|uniref:Sodium/potassium-transporting ATPase subunit beta n=1 Tax=Schistocephalus solidus TaxID=70667 RepID=A0A183SMD4_SCHSO|nr:unnamed protein product [Schistocephalus solidus]